MGKDTDDRFTRADALLDAALDLPSDERAGFLERECGDDGELRKLVDRLLRSAEMPTRVDGLGTGGAIDAHAEGVGGLVPDLAGQSLSDRYRLVRVIGRGGMGVVYEARDERLDRLVAVKILSVPTIDDRTRERFLREARAAAALNHPNVVAVHDAGEASGWPYLVMELVPGRGLDEQPPENLEEVAIVATHVCNALEHAHERGLVHRDLKPGNVLIVRRAEGTDPIVKLTDMGIALARGTARVTRTGAITGTPAYMAPEQALGQLVDGRADLYSLGVMLYLWAAGRLPFDGEDALAVVSQHIHAPVVPPRTFRPDLPAGLEPLILRLLSKNPEERPATAAEVREALLAVAAGAEEPSVPSAGRVAIEGLARGRMVGRRRELKRLQEMWRAAGVGRGGMALISGEPGVGKTRLAREMTAAAQLDGALVLAGGCYENEATTPYLPFLEAFRRFVRERADEALSEALGDTAAEIARLAPEIESRLGPFPDRPTLTPQEERLRLFDHIARFLRRLAGQRGLLFFFDDLQWADHGSLALLHYLLRQLGSERILFLGTYREVELDRAHALSKTLVDWNRERLAERVRLDRLNLEDTERMVGTLLGQERIAGEFVESLYAETEGNPFFVEEIVKALIAEGDLVHEKTAWQRRTTGEFVLPQSVKAAIGSRIERVSEPCAAVLHTAAVLGKTFEFAELHSVAGRGEDELLDALDEAVSAQLLAAGRGESFAFTHDKIREVLYDELNPIRRRRLHAKIAAGLEKLHEQGAAVAVEDLAHHSIEGGDYEKGLHWAREAAAAAQHVFAWDEALEMLERARECAEALGRTDDVVRIDETRGGAAFAQGDLVDAAAYYELALEATTEPDRTNAIRGKAGEVYVTSGDPRGLEHVRRALEELDPERLPHETAQAMVIEARYLHLRAELDRAVERYLPAIELAEQVGDPDLLVRALAYLAGTYQHLARFEESDAASRRCIEIGERENFPGGIMFGCEFLSENAYYRGFWEDGIRNGEREEAVALEVHAGERYHWAHFRAFMLHQVGRVAEAERLFRRGAEESRETGERRLELFMRMGWSECLLDLGRADNAEKIAREVVKESDDAELIAHRISGRSFLIRILLQQRRFRDALAEARAAIELWERSGSLGVGLIHGAVFGEALVLGRAAAGEVLKTLDAHRALAEQTRAEHRLAQNARVRGLLAAREQDAAAALPFFDDAIEKLETCGSRIEWSRALEDRARILRESGREADAAADEARARALRDECGLAPWYDPPDHA
jgi:tetratricopeptide (TPR) repeat protein